MERFYYKAKNNTGFLNLKTRLDKEQLNEYEEITQEEFEELTKPPVFTPTAEQKAAAEKAQLIAEKKVLLNKYREDVEQVSLFGMERDDYEEKKVLCKTLVEELRVLEQEVKNG